MNKEINNLDYIPNCVFATDNPLEIPSLKIEMQPATVEIPFVLYGEQKIWDMEQRGTLHFYSDDWRFSKVYESPENIFIQNPANIVEPNFTTMNEMPIAFAMQAIYKKRWVARMCQEKGIRVFVDLNVGSKFYKLNMIGVPKGYHCFATRAYNGQTGSLQYEYDLAKEWSGENDLLFCIYGGGKEAKEFADANGCIYVTPVVQCVNNRDKERKAIEQNVAFLNDDFDASKLLVSKEEGRYRGQVVDYHKAKQLKEAEKKKPQLSVNNN